ncbi:DNA-binding protein [bacterium]|nr:MAG: DNA-binding protein [bacterium]
MPRRTTPRSAVMNTREAAVYLGLSKSTLEKMRTQRDDGPPFVRLGRGAVRYRVRDLDDHLAEQALRIVIARARKRGETTGAA